VKYYLSLQSAHVSNTLLAKLIFLKRMPEMFKEPVLGKATALISTELVFIAVTEELRMSTFSLV
jgi:hypothetical protein